MRAGNRTIVFQKYSVSRLYNGNSADKGFEEFSDSGLFFFRAFRVRFMKMLYSKDLEYPE